jgi:malonate-semialdehyde dehydrogenase (acetylating)/methylmalonate-semialdehyde dehydrogenase
MELRKVKNYINGRWIDSAASEFLDVMNPTRGEAIARVPLSGKDEVEQAVAAARAAFPGWRETPPLTRARYMFKLKELMEENVEVIARIITEEEGKTLDESRGEVRRGIENVEVAAGIPSMMMGYNLEDVARDIDCVAVRQPVGVFAAIAPFNFPAMVPLWFLPYAVACGNTFVLKPSEQVPLTQEKIFRLIDDVGLPPGVINLINGSKEAVDALLDSEEVDGISFVGSSPVAKYVYEKAGSTGKRAQCLGGAKNFLVVMPDASLKETVEAVITSCFGCAGERCLAGSVILGVGDIYEPLKERLVDSASRLKIGNGLNEDIQMGPVISRPHLDRILGYIDKGLEEGATLLLDGRGVQVEGYPGGYFIGPTIFEDVRPEATIANEEIFGPLLSMIKVDSLGQAIDIIRANHYGNTTSIFTSSGKAAREFKYRVECSMIGINVGVAAPMAFFSFGGAKGSFFGDLKGHGRDSIEFYTDKKMVISRWF